MAEGEPDPWLAAFHAGEREAPEACYRRHVAKVHAAARAVVGAVDAETVTHEVFCRLIGNPTMPPASAEEISAPGSRRWRPAPR